MQALLRTAHDVHSASLSPCFLSHSLVSSIHIIHPPFCEGEIKSRFVCFAVEVGPIVHYVSQAALD
jgi:hypothetical protein